MYKKHKSIYLLNISVPAYTPDSSDVKASYFHGCLTRYKQQGDLKILTQ